MIVEDARLRIDGMRMDLRLALRALSRPEPEWDEALYRLAEVELSISIINEGARLRGDIVATDDERRRVAAALREYASFDCECEDDEDCLVDCADWGERVINLLDCGDTECECYAALADLIDPDTTSDTAKREPDTTKCDREALLALTGELDRSLSWCEPDEHGFVLVSVGRLRGVARRIRELCGEVVS